jgi:hypothetical protein
VTDAIQQRLIQHRGETWIDLASYETLLMAARGLAKFVRDEFPRDTSLHEIASTWGLGASLTAEEVAAIGAAETRLGESA